jgi:outer membrane protein assembly factor BamB
MIVNCPACGTPASIEPAYFGKKLRCANTACRQTFRVSPDGTVQMDLSRPAAPRTYDWQDQPPQQPAEAQGQEGDWLSAPPPRAGQPGYPQQPTYQQWQPEEQPMAGEVVVAAVETGDEEEEDEEYVSTHKTGEYSYGAKKKNRILFVVILVFVVVLGASIGAYVLYSSNKAHALAKLKDEYEKAFVNRRWDEAAEKGKLYRAQVKDAAEAKSVEFKVGFSELQLKLTPGQLNNLENLKGAINSFLTFQKANQSAPQYKELRKEMAEAGFTLVKSGSEFFEKNPDGETYQNLEQVMVQAASLKDALPGGGEELADLASTTESKFKNASVAIQADIAKKNWSQQYEEVLGNQNLGGVDAVLNAQKELVKQHPILANDADIKEKLSSLRGVEPTWVKFNGKVAPPSGQKKSFGPSIRICPPVKTPEGVEDNNQVVLAMARGTLYGLSARTGEDRWALRVGQDLKELPPRVVLGGDQPDLVFVVTTEDEGKTYLSQMNIQTGERLWLRQLQGPCPAGATLISNNRLLAVPMKNTIAIIESASGRQVAEYTIPGYDISTAPAYDRNKDRLFVPVDRGRIFVLDLANKKCAAVIYSEHGAGQLRGAPVIVENALIVCVAAGAGMGETLVKVFDIAQETPVQTDSFTLQGQVSSTPYVDGIETVGIVTDNGFLTLLGVGKAGAPSNAKGTTPVYILASSADDNSKKMQLKIDVGSELKTDQPRPRVQVAHVAMNDWWVFSHDHLIRNVYDPFHKQLLPSPIGALPLGNPLHRAEVSPDTRNVIVVTQPKNDPKMLASAIDRTTGRVVWQRQLGTEASQDPVAVADDVAMLDRGGAIFYVKASEIKDSTDWQKVGTWPGLAVAAASHRLVKSPNGQMLVGVSFNPARARMIVRKIDLQKNAATTVREVPHTFAPVGTPAAFDDGTVLVPCKDGNIYQFSFTSGTSNSLFSWRDPAAPTTVTGHLLLISQNQLLATNGMNKIYRWDRSNPQAAWRRNTNNLEIPGRITTALCRLPEGKVAVGDSAQNLHCLTLTGLGMAKQWNVQGTITKGPFLVGPNGLGCIVDGRRAWWVNTVDEDEAKTFAAEDLVGIVGEGTTVGDDLLLAVLRRDKSLGMVAQYVWVDLASARAEQSERLPVGLAPSSGASPLGKTRAFAPLTDGTVRILQKSNTDTAANPQG